MTAPSSPSALRSLIARLEGATEGSEELDEAIWAVLVPYGGRSTAMLNKSPFGDLGFSRSLDAALTLVPEGLYWILGKGRIRPTEPLHGMQLFIVFDDGSFDSGAPFIESEHENREICVLIAVLKARETTS